MYCYYFITTVTKKQYWMWIRRVPERIPVRSHGGASGNFVMKVFSWKDVCEALSQLTLLRVPSRTQPTVHDSLAISHAPCVAAVCSVHSSSPSLSSSASLCSTPSDPSALFVLLILSSPSWTDNISNSAKIKQLVFRLKDETRCLKKKKCNSLKAVQISFKTLQISTLCPHTRNLLCFNTWAGQDPPMEVLWRLRSWTSFTVR